MMEAPCTLEVLPSQNGRLKLPARPGTKFADIFLIEFNGGHTKVGSSGYCAEASI
jgi:hypothetical protein